MNAYWMWEPWMRYFNWQPWDIDRLTPRMVRDGLADLKQNPPLM